MKVVYDTCIYIEFLRSGQYEDIFRDRSHIRYLSPIVMMELVAGVRNQKQRRGLEKLFLPYSKAHRLIDLNTNHYFKAGEILSKLKAGSTHLSHDILIAMSALSVGAKLVTSNKKDFQRIAKLLPVKVSYL